MRRRLPQLRARLTEVLGASARLFERLIENLFEVRLARRGALQVGGQPIALGAHGRVRVAQAIGLAGGRVDAGGERGDVGGAARAERLELEIALREPGLEALRALERLVEQLFVRAPLAERRLERLLEARLRGYRPFELGGHAIALGVSRGAPLAEMLALAPGAFQ